MIKLRLRTNNLFNQNIEVNIIYIIGSYIVNIKSWIIIHFSISTFIFISIYLLH